MIEWDWLDRKYCAGEIRGEDGSWRSLFALLRAGVLLLLLLLLLRSRMRSRHLARPRDPLTLALATTCSQSPSPCAITIANTANTATTTTPPHHHTRCAPSILTTAVAPRPSSNHVSRIPPPSLRASQTPSALHPKTHSWPHTTPPQTTRLSPRMTESSSDSVANGTIALSPILHDAPLTLCASSNMLYPREDKETNQLIFQCRNCQWPTAVGPTCIYRNEVSHNLRETAGVVTDVASDPTVCYFRPPPSIPLKLTSTSATPCRERLRKPEMRRKRRRLLPKSAT